MSRPTLIHRVSTGGRLVAAVVGGYLLTSSLVALLALLLPMEPAEAVLTATMLSFAIYAAIVLSVFAARNAWSMWLYLVAAIAVLKVALWASME
nr:hypothetical protein [uncultured Steroidobacter sp.]